ncbi:MAG: 2-oxoglutarate dehydrogenase, E2 component, dihydrolipoamide succinyltransferase [Bryobacteraceae bacterium]
MTDVVMPQMGESIVEGTLTRWLKKVGDRVERDEPLFEISTDKVDTEIPSPVEGTLSDILVQEGATVAVNTIVGKIGDGASSAASAPAAKPAKPEPVPAPPPAEAPKAAETAAPAAPPAQPKQAPAAGPYPPTPGPAPAPIQEEEPGPLSPLVRKMAREYNIDLSQVRGTGAGGRITKQDVEAYMASQGAHTVSQAAAAPVTAPSPSPAPPAPVSPPAQPPLPRAEAAKTRVEAMSTMRKKIAEHMVFSKHTSAHVTTVHRIDMTRIAKLRDKVKGEFQARNGFSLTFLPFVAVAAAQALREFPIVNASIDGTNIVYHTDVNIGIAVAMDDGLGLIVPVIRNADEKNVAGLQRSIVDLATRARSRQLKPDEVAGGTFTITNFGSFGSIFATPVINQPQVAILGVGAVEKVPAVVDGDAIAVRSQAYLALTFDHRLVDGALADQFCQKAKKVLENWDQNVL